MGRRERAEFEHAFEGKEVLDELLEIAGATVDSQGVLERMQQAHAKKESRESVVPTLFEGEPKFPDPSLARRMFQNLLGLWDLVERGENVQLDSPPVEPRRPRTKKSIPERPTPFEGEPTAEWVEWAWKYLDEAPDREVQRLEHSFENRQDTLLGHLDEQGLSDEVFVLARQLLFELHAMIELGWPAGIRSVAREQLEDPTEGAPPPKSLQAYADEAFFEAEQDEQAPLKPADSARVRALVNKGLTALWSAREAERGEQ